MDSDPGLERLLDLHGFSAEIGGGYWVKIEAVEVPADVGRPHGVAYSLTMHTPGGARIIGIDNAHPVRRTSGPGGKRALRRDHLHRGKSVRPYPHRSADDLLDDFWNEVAAVLRREGIE